MTVVHQHPHPLAMRVVSPTNSFILKKFGMVRVEDWDDRVSGVTFTEKLKRGTFFEAECANQDLDSPEVAEGCSKVLKMPSSTWEDDFVRCHSTTTGDLILLHDDWLPTPEQP